jgi:hypothetical protein
MAPLAPGAPGATRKHAPRWARAAATRLDLVGMPVVLSHPSRGWSRWSSGCAGVSGRFPLARSRRWSCARRRRRARLQPCAGRAEASREYAEREPDRTGRGQRSSQCERSDLVRHSVAAVPDRRRFGEHGPPAYGSGQANRRLLRAARRRPPPAPPNERVIATPQGSGMDWRPLAIALVRQLSRGRLRCRRPHAVGGRAAARSPGTPGRRARPRWPPGVRRRAGRSRRRR